MTVYKPRDEMITVGDLIEALSELPEDALVRATFVGGHTPLVPGEILYVLYGDDDHIELHIDDEQAEWPGRGIYGSRVPLVQEEW